MPAFYLTLLAVLLGGFAARDQLTIASLAQAQRRRPGILLTALGCVCVTATLAAAAGAWMLTVLPTPARGVFVALALGVCGLEAVLSLVFRRLGKDRTGKTMREPTRSLGALGLVLMAEQLTDAARFIVFAMAVGMAAPWVSGAAGAMAGAVLVTFAWASPNWFETGAARWVRAGTGSVLLLAAAVAGLRNIGVL